MTIPDSFSLSRLFISPYAVPQSPTLTQDVAGGTMTYWDPVTHANTVVVGPVTYQNLPVVSSVGLTTGLVLLMKAPGGYIIMGMLSRASSTVYDPVRHRVLSNDLPLPNTTLIDAPALSFGLNPATQYAMDGCLFYNSTTSNDIQFAWTGPANMSVKWNMHGLSNATTNGILTDLITNYGSGSPQTIQGLGALSACHPSGWFSTTDTPGVLQLQAALASGTTAGLLAQGSWLRLSEISGTGLTDTVIKQYACTASRSYAEDGTYIGATDGDNNVYFGSFPDRSFGNERSVLIFPGATMRADLGAATVLSARLYLYCFKAEETQGSFQGRAESYTAVPTTYSPPTGAGFGVNDIWTVPSWNSIECFYTGSADSYLNRILAGDSAVGLTPTSFGLAATGFRGYGFSAALRPYIEVAYAV